MERFEQVFVHVEHISEISPMITSIENAKQIPLQAKFLKHFSKWDKIYLTKARNSILWRSLLRRRLRGGVSSVAEVFLPYKSILSWRQESIWPSKSCFKSWGIDNCHGWVNLQLFFSLCLNFLGRFTERWRCRQMSKLLATRTSHIW